MENHRLPKKQLRRIKEAHSQAKRGTDPVKPDKLKAVYLLGSGWRISDVCSALLLDERTVRDYYRCYKASDLEALLATGYVGSTGYLSESEEASLDDYLQAHPCQSTIEIIAYVELTYEVNYSVSGMNHLLKRLNYSYKKPRQVPGKADKVKQAAFVKAYYKLRCKMEPEDSLFFLDGVHPQHNSIAQYGWFKRGVDVPLYTNTRYHRLNIQGAMDIDTHEVVSHFSPTLNEEAALDLLEKLRKKRPSGWIYCVLDNAGYYDTKRVRAYAQACAIQLVFLPPYSPNLNLIERLWKFMNKRIFYNTYYPTFEQFKQACLDFFRTLPQHKNELVSLMAENFETLPI